MSSIFLFIFLGIMSREFMITIPLILTFSIIYVIKNKFDKRKTIILFLLLIFSFSQSYIRFNTHADNSKIKSKGIITDVRNYDKYNRITIRSGIKKYYTYDKTKKFIRGDIVKYAGVLKKHERRSMPLLFDARNYYYSNGINYKIDNANLKFVSKSFLSGLESLRIRASEIFDNKLSPSAADISKGITLRYREDTEIIKNIVDVGLSHILSVSGLHLGIIFIMIFYLISLTGVGIKLRYLLSCIIMFLYSFMIGFNPSLLRALIMIFVLMYKRIYRPNISDVDSLLFTASVSLIINPYYIYSIGFILSYLCIYGIIFIFRKFRKLYSNKDGFKNKFYSALFLNISIQIATLPIVIYFFNKINIFSILINILLVPIFTLYLILSMLLLFTSRINIISTIIAFVLNNIMSIFDFIASIFNNSIFNLILKSPPLIIIVIYYIMLFYLLRYDKIKYLRIDYRAVMIMLVILSIPSPLHFTNQDRIEFLDVGQGDSALITIGGKNILIDSGGNRFNIGSVGENILEPYLIKTGRRNIDIALITHFDYDHVGGFTEVSDKIKIKNMFANHFHEGDDSEHSKRIKNLNYKILKEDANLKINKNYTLSLIPGNTNLNNENNRSAVSVLRKNNANLVYFSADIEKEAEKLLLKNSPNTFILKVPHHGSKTSSTDKFLDKIKPKKAVISVGRNNKYGHPNGEVLKRYKKRDIELFRTDRDGLITLDLNTLKFYRCNDYDPMFIIIFYIQFILSLFIVLYKEERWITQYF